MYTWYMHADDNYNIGCPLLYFFKLTLPKELNVMDFTFWKFAGNLQDLDG